MENYDPNGKRNFGTFPQGARGSGERANLSGQLCRILLLSSTKNALLCYFWEYALISLESCLFFLRGQRTEYEGAVGRFFR